MVDTDSDSGFADLFVLEDLSFQRRDWRAQRIGWAVIALIVVAALAGLVGPGPLSHSSVTADDDSVTVQYQRFARRGGSADMVLEVSSDVVSNGAVQILLSRDYLEQMTVEAIVPEPGDQTVVGDAVQFTVPVSEPADPIVVQLTITPNALGAVAGTASVSGGSEIRFSQFLYP